MDFRTGILFRGFNYAFICRFVLFCMLVSYYTAHRYWNRLPERARSFRINYKPSDRPVRTVFRILGLFRDGSPTYYGPLIIARIFLRERKLRCSTSDSPVKAAPAEALIANSFRTGREGGSVKRQYLSVRAPYGGLHENIRCRLMAVNI